MIVRFGFYPTRWGKRRRFRCKMCRRTFCRNRGTVYHRLQHRRATFDEVAALSVEGMNKSAIARVQQIAWNTVDRWLEKAAVSCRRFNDQRITKIRIRELQADEIRTLVGSREHPPVWIFAAIEVWSRLWPATVVGKRSYRNTLTLFQDLVARATGNHLPLIATDGFKFYRQVVRRLFWGGLPVRTSHKETKKRSRGQSAAESQDRCGMALERGVEKFGGFPPTEHFLHRTVEPDYPAGLSLPASSDPQPRSANAAVGRSSRTAPMPLQLPPAASCAEVWTRS